MVALLTGCASVPGEVVVKGDTYELVATPEELAAKPRSASDGDTARTDATLLDEAERVEYGDGPTPLHEWDREELALALRSTIVHRNGGLYVQTEPAWDAADAILNANGEAGAPQAVEWVARTRAAGDPDVGRHEAKIIGSDDRILVTNTTVHPRRATIRLELYNGTSFMGQCTGSYIGPWTVLTSAHCVHLSDGTIINRIVFSPAQNGPTGLPDSQFDCRNDDPSTTNDILIAYPAGWQGDWVAQNSLDYAVIDTYPCHGATALFNGYLVDSASGAYDLFGYPASCAAAPGPDTFQCGMSGAADINGHRIESGTIDASKGQSGGPWSTFVSSQHWVSGMHSGYREYYDFIKCGFDVCRRSFGRRIDGTVNTFIKANSFDF